MAKLLVKAVDGYFEPERENQTALKSGDIISIVGDDHEWSPSEGLPRFERIDLPGVSPKSIAFLLDSEEENVGEVTSLALRKNKKLFRQIMKNKYRNIKTRCRYKIDTNTLEITDKVSNHAISIG